VDGSFGLDAWVVAVSWPLGSWQNFLKVVLAGLFTYLIALWLVTVWWTFRDIRERTRDPFLQAAAVFAVMIFNLPGLWMYLIIRPKETLAEAYGRALEEEALLQELEDLKACPTCRRRVADDFIVCPVCQTQLKEPCAGCSRPLSYAWAACPFCGRERRGVIVERQPAPRPAEPVAVATENGAHPEPIEPTQRLRRPAIAPAPPPVPAAPAPAPAFTTRNESEAPDPA
jgi:hypothetical protein